MKTKHLFFAFLATCFFSSFTPKDNHILSVGEIAPSLAISDISEAAHISTEKEYLLINFWSASDPASRIKNKLLSRIYDGNAYPEVSFVSICTDDDSTLRDEIIKADGIADHGNLLNISDLNVETASDFQTESGLRTFLIDKYGVLRAVSSDSGRIIKIALR